MLFWQTPVMLTMTWDPRPRPMTDATGPRTWGAKGKDWGSIIWLHTIKCCSVVFGITLRLLVINISSLSPAINKLHRLLPAMCHNWPRSGIFVLITPSRSQRWQYAMKPDMCSESRFLPPHLHLTPLLGRFPSEYCQLPRLWYGKSRMMWLPNGEKFWRYVYLFR